MKGKQISAVLEEVSRFELRELDIPEIQSDEALLQVEMAGVCRTDASFYRGKTRAHLIPLILGHEILGNIAAIGGEAERNYGVREGDRVVVESSIRCGYCRYCVSGNYQLCDNRRSYGTSMTVSTPPHIWGAYGQYMYLAPGSGVHRISESVPAEAAVLTCSVMANGIQWVRHIGQVNVGDVVVIQGAGQQGLAATVAAREAGAGLILMTGLTCDARRFELARTLGADFTIDVEKEDVEERVRELTQGAMSDVLLDVTGSPEALAEAVALVRKGGCIVAASVLGDEALVPVHADQLLFKQITLKFVYTNTDPAVRAAIQLIESRKYPLEEMVTDRFKLSEADQAVQTVAGDDSKNYPIKVAIVP